MDRNRELFEAIYGDSSVLNEYDLLALLYILPIVHNIRGDKTRIAHCLTLLIGYSVNIDVRLHGHRETMTTEPQRLGEATLGVTSVSGNSFQSFNKFYDIRVLNVEEERMTAFFPGGDRYAVIQYVSNFLFPYDSHVRIIPEVPIAAREAYLSDSNHGSYLGFNCYMGTQP